MKVYDYIIVLRRPDYKIVDRISQFMLSLAIAVFVFTAFVPFTVKSALPLVIAAFIIAWWLFCYRQQKKGLMPFYRLALFLAACGWYIQPNGFWPATIYLVAALIEKQVKFPPEVAFDETEIVFNTLPKKRFSWDMLSNVVLKDNLITIDFKNNKLIQKEIESTATLREEQDFNEFCRKMLNTTV
ncbi:MAG: hypothetical protein NVSMB63_17140 [Sediminibacterium sp.]